MAVMTRPPATESVSRNWWLFIVHGIVAIVFGVLAIFWPGLTLGVLVILFGAWALVDGVIGIVSAFRSREGMQWSLLLWGIVGIAAGIAAFVWPGLTALALVFLIGAWAIVTGVAQIGSAIALRREINDEWLLILVGVLSIVAGVLFFLFPGAGALSVVWLIGAYAIARGIVELAAGFRFRNLQRRMDTATGTGRAAA